MCGGIYSNHLLQKWNIASDEFACAKKMKISVNSLISNGQEVRGYPPFGTAGRAIITINPVVLNFIGTSSNFGTMTYFCAILWVWNFQVHKKSKIYFSGTENNGVEGFLLWLFRYPVAKFSEYNETVSSWITHSVFWRCWLVGWQLNCWMNSFILRLRLLLLLRLLFINPLFIQAFLRQNFL